MKPRAVIVALSLTLWTAMWASPGWAGDGSEKGAFSILFENDLFYNSDHDYTNGIELAYTTAPQDTPDWAVRTARLLPFFAQDGDVRARYALGQAIFTPHNLKLKNPPLTDRPYAGFLYGAFGLVDDTGRNLDQLQIQLGVIGPASLAEDTQKFVHGIIHGQDPQGWSTQLRDEPGLVIQYERSIKLIPPQSVLGLVFDAEPHYGIAIGNVYDYVNAGAMARLGFNLPKDYGPLRLDPSLPGSGFFEPTGGFGAYIFAGVDGRAIARNLFLDGNSFEQSRSVTKMNLVGDISIGAAVVFDSFQVSFTHVIRSREYKTQKADDQFGAVDLSFRF